MAICTDMLSLIILYLICEGEATEGALCNGIECKSVEITAILIM